MNKNLIYTQQQVAAVVILIASAFVVMSNKSNDTKPEGDVQLYYVSTGAISALTDHPGDIKYPVYYGDSFFRSKSTEENIHMANFAYALELSCCHFESKESEKVSQVNLKAILGDIGFTNVEINKDFESEPEIDSIGVGIGSKVIDGSTVLAVVINGVQYTAQFGGNFKVGQTGTHEGFQIAADKAVQFIKEYISEKQITGNIKILTTGYSRGAAASNITQAMIDDAIAEGKVKDLLGDVNLSKEGMYGYGFMTPMTAPVDGKISPSDSRYSNIYNYVDPNDLVPMVPPSQFKFTHYGKVIKMPSNDKDIIPVWYRYITNYFGEEVQKTYDRSTFKPAESLKGQTEGEVLKGYLDKFIMTATGGDRQYYYKEVQEYFSWGVFILFSHTEMLNDVMNQLTDDILSLTIASIAGKEYLKKELHNCLNPLFKKYGLNDRDGESIVTALTILTTTVVKTQGGVINILTDPYLKTFMDNGKYMIMAHMPSNMSGWLYYLDPYYPEGGIKQ